MSRRRWILGIGLLVASACQCGGVASDEAARLSYLGLDPGIGRALGLGFDGFNAASSANIPTQTADGATSGTMTVSGQVDQGSSANKGMRLQLALVEYADPFPSDVDASQVQVQYATPGGAPLALELQLRDIPSGTMTGTLKGSVQMEGDLNGELGLDLALAGDIEEDPDHPGQTRRQAGTIRVTGTAVSDYGEYAVDLTR